LLLVVAKKKKKKRKSICLSLPEPYTFWQEKEEKKEAKMTLLKKREGGAPILLPEGRRWVQAQVRRGGRIVQSPKGRGGLCAHIAAAKGGGRTLIIRLRGRNRDADYPGEGGEKGRKSILHCTKHRKKREEEGPSVDEGPRERFQSGGKAFVAGGRGVEPCP